MFPPDQYRLVDFGAGRRLERFGDYLIDRPSPPAEGLSRSPDTDWAEADAVFQRTGPEQGTWQFRRRLPERWTIARGTVRLELKFTQFGHLGVFPEHSAHWDWIAEQVAAGPIKVLNLFAYTGGSTLAAAAAGAEVVHVDSARNTVAWARRNAELAGLAEKPIRWIAEEATKFCRREVRRGSRYDAVILDPPSYGHGPRGEVWRLSKHLAPLLELCRELTAPAPRFLLLTCHTPDFDGDRLAAMLGRAMPVAAAGSRLSTMPMRLSCKDRHLPSGVAVRLER